MSDPLRREIATLEMDPAGNAPQGALISADGIRRAFSGWTELAVAIEEWRARRADAARGREIAAPAAERLGGDGRELRQ